MANKTYTHALNIQGPEGYTARFEIPIGITIISRQPGVGLQLDNKYISRRHSRLECIDTECHLTDLGSDNGTYLNGEKLAPDTPTLLNHHDHIKIGPFGLEVEKIETVAEAEAPVILEEKAVEAEIPVEEPSAPATPPPPPPPEEAPIPAHPPEEELLPPGLTIKSQRLINYLPGIYQSDFMARFLGIFESIITPIEWNIENFDLFLSPQTSPSFFLQWLANWYEIVFDDTWSETKRRNFLREAYHLYALAVRKTP